MYVSSLTLGVLAWGFGVAAIKSKQSPYRYSVISFSLCAVSLFFQFVQFGNLFEIRDFAAIEDTIGAVIFAAGVLVVVTIILNVIAIIRNQARR